MDANGSRKEEAFGTVHKTHALAVFKRGDEDKFIDLLSDHGYENALKIVGATGRDIGRMGKEELDALENEAAKHIDEISRFIGCYGAYSGVATTFEMERPFWSYGEGSAVLTFCGKGDEDRIAAVAMDSVDYQPKMDFFPGSVLMLRKYDSRVGKKGFFEMVAEFISGEKAVHAIINTPFGDWQKVGSYAAVLSDEGEYCKQRGRGSYTPLPGSRPKRGELGEKKKVPYEVFRIGLKRKYKDLILQKIMTEAIKAYELPVVSFIEDVHYMDQVMPLRGGA